MTKKSFRAMSREAQSKGLKTFDPGKPCNSGHVSHRYANKNCVCIECATLANEPRSKALRDATAAKIVVDIDLVITKNAAKAMGQPWYFTGKKCKKGGHLARRNVSNSGCQKCAMDRFHAKPKENPKKFLTKREDGTYFGIACRKCGCKERTTEKKCPVCRDAYEEKFSKEISSRARANRAMSVPLWLTNEHKKQIADIYKNRPDGYHVDHLVPLRGKYVTGLHLPVNMQYLSISENTKKRNKFPTCQRSMQPAYFDTLIWYMSAE